MEPYEKLSALRKLMKQDQIDAWLVPSADPHQSEFVADCWRARAWVSGFTGSAGTLVVMQAKAGLWTDPRYHIRAAEELRGSGIDLYKFGLPGVPSYKEWLQQELWQGACIGFDGSVLSVKEVEELKSRFKDKEIRFLYEYDLVNRLWQDRPEIPANPIFLHDIRFTGESRQSKFQRIRDKLEEQGVQVHLITALDDIAWTMNIRGGDIPYNPLAISYALVSEGEARLFIHPQKAPAEVREALEKDGVQFSQYEEIYSYWRQLSPGTTVLIDPDKTSYKLERMISEVCRVRKGASLPHGMKARKNETELDGIRKAHIRDGVAVVKWMHWLDQQIGKFDHTEITLADQLERFRSQVEGYQGLSFNTISAYQANSAVGHYSPKPETTPNVKPEGILLIDSGGQYLDGTTDVTRTITLGRPTPGQRRVFTQVLKALIMLTTTKFPQGTTGSQLDAIARAHLWKQGWNCRHNIGHGVGHYLNVHEGPQRFAPDNFVPIEPGMVSSIEPGVYFEGNFGVRIENLVVVVQEETTSFGNFYGFETLTWCPIDLNLVDASILSSEEKSWLNNYHRAVFQQLVPFLSQDEIEWLESEAREI